MKNKRLRRSISFASIIIIFVIGFSGFLFGNKIKKMNYKNQDEIANPLFQIENISLSPTPPVSYPDNFVWKEFVDKNFGISFLYPSTVNTPILTKDFPSPINPKADTDDLKTIPEILIKSDHPVGPDDAGPITIEKLGKTTIVAWLEANAVASKTYKNVAAIVYPVNSQDTTIIRTTFQKYPAVLLQPTYGQQDPTVTYLVQVDDTVYRLDVESAFFAKSQNGPEYQQYNTEFNKTRGPLINAILASIKFNKWKKKDIVWKQYSTPW